MGLRNADTVCPVVPMFHVNAWGLPFTTVMTGAKFAFPGPHLDAVSLLDLYQSEQVTLERGRADDLGRAYCRRSSGSRRAGSSRAGMRMVVGGSAAPESMIRAFDRHRSEGDTRLGHDRDGPGRRGELSQARAGRRRTPTRSTQFRAKQGCRCPSWSPRDDAAGRGAVGRRGDGRAGSARPVGRVRRITMLAEESDKWSPDGWFRTGDVVTMDAHGYIKITDRIKDLVKSGGEWISSVDLENALVGHPKVAEAAVIAVADAKWGERPLAVVVLKAGQAATRRRAAGFPGSEVREDLAPGRVRFRAGDPAHLDGQDVEG